MSLGKGLSALITPTTSGRRHTTLQTSDGSHSAPKLWNVPLSEIKPDPNQPRKQFKPEELKELAQSIKEHGVLQPLLVSELESGGYQIIAGERRYRASLEAGLTNVPVIVKKMAEEKKLEVSLIENIQRENLNPIEEAFAFKRLGEEFGLTQQQIADRVGKSRPAVANAIRLLELPQEIQKALTEGAISMGQGRALLGVENKAAQLDLLASMLGKKITVREIEKTVAGTRPAQTPARTDANTTYLEQRLRESVGAKVSITKKGTGGAIVIEYHSADELSEIVKKIVE